MTTIVTRAGKGSPLTNNEVDSNFTNLNDAKIETLTSTDTSVTITGTGSSRNLSVPINPNVVSGPASATDNAITRFDGTTGKLIQNSTVTIDDNGNILNVNSIGLDTTPATVPTTVGTTFWDDNEGTPSVLLKGGNTTLQVGAQEYARVYNDSGAILTKGQAVYIFGAQGNRISVKLARANLEATSYGTLGLVAETIGIGAEGYIIVSGALYKIDTTGFTAGATVYLSPTTAGAITGTKPQAPDQLVIIGFVERVDNIVGSIYVKIDNGYELDELHDVQITSPQSGNMLIYDATTTPIGVWKNANLTDGTGISITEGAGSVTIANTGVLSVSGTSPVASSGGATPAISLAANYGDTLNPYASKTANNFLAAPNGIAGAPTFRAIVAADIPTLNQNTTGTASNVTGTVAIANGGTGATTAAAARTNLGATTVGGNFYTLANPTAVTFPRINADNTVSALDATTFRTAIGAGTGSGTVTGVTATSPVASSGGTAPVISLSAGYGDTLNPYGSKTANFILAAPTGIAGAPTFRAMVAADVPTLNQNTTGTASNVTGTVAIANGGTGATTRQDAMDALAGAVTSGSYLRGNGVDVVMSTIQAADVPTLNQNTTGSAATLTTGRTIAITGDLTYTSPSFNGSANVTAAGTLATVNANVGAFGSSTAIPVVTVNAKGLVTAVSTATVAGGQYFGTAAVKAISYNANSIGENVTVTTGNNGLSAGPITINTGFTVTVQTGAVWVIV